MQKKDSKRFRLLRKVCSFRQIQKEIIKKQKTKSAITDQKITNLLKCTPNFIGCYAENELFDLTIQSYPCFIIVNIDSNDLPGSHWLALGLFKDRFEIVDPLGFTIFNWQRVPCGLLNFCHRFSVGRKIFVSKRVQAPESTLCGFYCMYYILYRSLFSFNFIFNKFSSYLKNNDSILIKQFS